MKNLIKYISIVLTLCSLAILFSCSSNTFSKRKYRKGVFKEHSARVKRDKSKAEEAYYMPKSNKKIDKPSENPKTSELKEVATTKLNDSIVKLEKQPFLKKQNNTQNDKKIEIDNTTTRSDSTTIPNKRLRHTSNKRIRRTTVNGFLSVFLHFLFSPLAFLFFLGGNMAAVLIVLAILFFTMIGTTIASLADLRLAKKEGVEEEDMKHYRRSVFLNILGLIILFLGLCLFLVLLIIGI